MDALNFIRKYKKEYIGNIDYSLLDEHNNSYLYYKLLLNDKNNTLFLSINKNNKLEILYRKNTYIINNNEQFIFGNNKNLLIINNNKLNEYEYITKINYLINDNKLLINIYKNDICNNYYYMFDNIFLTSNLNVKELKIIHNYDMTINHNGDTEDVYINLYIDYFPNLEKLNAKLFNIYMNNKNTNIKKINVSTINNWINNLNLNKIIYIPGMLKEMDWYNLEFFNFKNRHSLTDFINNQNNLNKIIFDNSSIIINSSFNKKIKCYDTDLLFNNNFNLNYLKINNTCHLKLLSKYNYFINKLILNKINYFQIKNKYNNYINCNKVKIRFIDFEKEKDIYFKNFINLLKIINTNNLILKIELEPIKFNEKNIKKIFNDDTLNVFKSKLYKNIKIYINHARIILHNLNIIYMNYDINDFFLNYFN